MIKGAKICIKYSLNVYDETKDKIIVEEFEPPLASTPPPMASSHLPPLMASTSPSMIVYMSYTKIEKENSVEQQYMDELEQEIKASASNVHPLLTIDVIFFIHLFTYF